jgi:hypothetical protein
MGMASSTRIRAILAGACTGLGTLWTAAGVLKLIFGIRVTFPIFPPIDLERVAAWPAVATGLLLVFLGAWLQRVSTASANDDSQILANTTAVPLLNTHLAEQPVTVSGKQESHIHRAPPA